MYHKEFIVQSDWMHHGEGLQLFNRMGLSIPADAKYQERARRFAGLYMAEDPEAPNYDPVHKIIRSMQNGSRGPMLRKATALDWVGDPFDVKGFDALHGESTFEQFLAHYEEYGDVAGDHFLNLVATTLPMTAYMVAGEPKYKKWIVEYMDAWLQRMTQNGGIIPSFVDLDGRIGGPEGAWWKNAYGWGFSPVNPVTGRREDRNRIPRALVGFSNALLVTGDQKYVDAWRTMMDGVNSHARETNGRKQYPTMHGAAGWYGWRDAPWNVGALEVWYWSQKPQDRERIGRSGWVDFLHGQNPAYPEQALERDLGTIQQRVAAIRRDTSTPAKRLADNMLDLNPAATDSLVQLMWGALLPGREGGLLNARLRYFDPDRRRAGVPEDVAALVSELSDSRTVVTLINLNPSQARTVIVQGGGYGEHQLVSVTSGDQTTPVGSPLLTVRLEPGCGRQLVLAMKRYAVAPTVQAPVAAMSLQSRSADSTRMFCPQCREEFPWQVMVCPACDVETVDRLPGPVPTPDAALVRVLAAGDPVCSRSRSRFSRALRSTTSSEARAFRICSDWDGSPVLFCGGAGRVLGARGRCRPRTGTVGRLGRFERSA